MGEPCTCARDLLVLAVVVAPGAVQMSRDYFAVFANHNAWANRRLYSACETLSPAEYLRERGSSHGSLHATLNHVLVTDRVWIARIEGRTPPALDDNQIVYADLLALKIARVAEDEHLRQLVAGLPDGPIDLLLHYMDNRGNRFAAPLRFVLAHLFDAQSRSRGEAAALLAQAGAPPPSLDFLAFLQETGARSRG
jgi:uncharacterized damage-inducible protein DinB